MKLLFTLMLCTFLGFALGVAQTANDPGQTKKKKKKSGSDDGSTTSTPKKKKEPAQPVATAPAPTTKVAKAPKEQPFPDQRANQRPSKMDPKKTLVYVDSKEKIFFVKECRPQTDPLPRMTLSEARNFRFAPADCVVPQ